MIEERHIKEPSLYDRVKLLSVLLFRQRDMIYTYPPA